MPRYDSTVLRLATHSRAISALLLLGIVLLRNRNKLQLVLAGAVLLLAAGVLDALAWGGGLFHSYLTNLRFNLILGPMRANKSPACQFLWWLTLAGGGLSALCLLPALRWPRRYGLLLALIALVLLTHSVQSHKEYRFIFAVIPLWLLIGAGSTGSRQTTAGLVVGGGRRRCGKSMLSQRVPAAEQVYFRADQRAGALQRESLAAVLSRQRPQRPSCLIRLCRQLRRRRDGHGRVFFAACCGGRRLPRRPRTRADRALRGAAGPAATQTSCSGSS